MVDGLLGIYGGTAGRGQVIVFLTLFDDPEYVDAALEAGARGYVLKQEPTVEMPKAILKVAHGETYLSPGLKIKQ